MSTSRLLKHRQAWCPGIIAAIVCILGSACIGGTTENSAPALPPGSTIYQTLHLSRFGHDYTVLLYSSRDHQHSATVLVYDPSLPDPNSVLLSDVLPGAGSFAPPTGLRKLLGTDASQIVVYRLLGASCEGRLDIYNIESSTVVAKLSTPWSDTCQDDPKIDDLSHDGIPEITFKTNVRDPVRAVYRWDGAGYKRDDAAFAFVNDQAVQQLMDDALAPQSLPLSARMQWFNEAIDQLMQQRRISEAITLCSRLIQVIRDPETTTPNTRLAEDDPQLNKRILAHYSTEERETEASILRKMGDLYKFQGDSEKARDYYQQADQKSAKTPN